MPDVVRVNATIYSWTNCLFKIDGQPFDGLISFNYEQKLERRIIPSSRSDAPPLGKSAGKYSVPSMSMRMLKDSANALTSYLITQAPPGPGLSYGQSLFVITFHIAHDFSMPPISIVCESCTIDGKKDVHDEGVDELVTEFEIGALRIRENGKTLWSPAP